MSATTHRMWIVSETPNAIMVAEKPDHRHITAVWLPRSQIQITAKARVQRFDEDGTPGIIMGHVADVTAPDWLASNRRLSPYALPDGAREIASEA